MSAYIFHKVMLRCVFLSCDCQAGYTGVTCETDIDECQSSPCQNDGTCFELLDEYECRCAPSYSGINCQTSKS